MSLLSRATSLLVRGVLALGVMMPLAVLSSSVAEAADAGIILNAVGAGTPGTGIRVKYQSGQFQVMRSGQNQLFKPDVQYPPSTLLYNGIAMSLTTSPTNGRTVYPTGFNLSQANAGSGIVKDTFDSYDTYLIDANGNRIAGTSTAGSGSFVSEMSFTDPGTNLVYKVTLRVDYAYPDEWMKQTFTVTIPAGNTRTIRLFNVYDTYLGASDAGPGFYQAGSATTVEMVYTQKTGVFEGLARLSGPQWAGYASERYANIVFSAYSGAGPRYGPGFGVNLTKVINSSVTTDNGIGVNWDFGTNGTTGSTAPPGSTVTTEPAVGLFTFAMPPAPPTISTTTVGPGSVNAPFSQSLAGTVNYGTDETWALTSGTLPPGLTLAADGTISGTPTTGGSYTYTVSLTDSLGVQSTKTYTTVISAGPQITTTSLPEGTTGTAYSQTVAATGGTGTLTYSLDSGALPAGLTLASDGTISGTPTGSGTSNFSVTVTDGGGLTDTQALSITVAAPVDITTTSLPGGSTGQSYTQTVQSSGGTGPYTYAVTSGSLPAGLTLASDGTISGTPTGSGTSTFSVTVTDAAGRTDTQALSIAISTPTITYNPNGASGSVSPTTGAVGSNVTLATNGFTPPSGQNFLGWSTDPNATTPTYTAGQQITMPATGLNLYAVWNPPLVASITYNGSGALGSTSPTAGTVGSNVTVAANGFTAPAGATFLGWSTNPSAVTPDPTYDPGDSVTVPAGGTSLYAVWSPAVSVITYSANGGTGTIANTPAANGSTVTVSSNSGLTAPAGKVFLGWSTNPSASSPDPAYDPGDSVTMPVGGVSLHAVWGMPPDITTTSLPDGTTGTSYSQAVNATGGTGPYSFAVTTGSLPAGLSMSSSGAITGTPTASGTLSFSVTVTDATGLTDTQALSIAVSSAPSGPTITTPSLPDGETGAGYAWTMAATGGTGALTFSLDAGSLPAGLSLASDGTITGTPTTAGSSTFTVKVTDANSLTDTQVYTVNISAPGALAISTPSIADGVTGTPYSQTVAATGGTGPYSFTVASGSLPSGLTMASDGTITGTPTTVGSSTFTVEATDSTSATATRTYTVNITDTAPAPEPTPTPPPTWTLTYDANGGSAAPGPQSGVDGTWVNMPGAGSISRPGFSFTGWNTRPDGNGLGFAPGAPTQLSGDNTLFAQWTLISVRAADGVNATMAGMPVAGNAARGGEFPPGSAFTKAADPSNGTAIVNPDGTYSYTPSAGFTGTDAFAYTVCAPGGTPCSTATVTITVAGIPTPPILTTPNAPVQDLLAVPGSTPPGSVFTVVTPPQHGIVDLKPAGEFVYTPNPGFSGTDQFSYQVCVPGASVCPTATVTITVDGGQAIRANPIIKQSDATNTDPMRFAPATFTTGGSIMISQVGTSSWVSRIAQPGKGTWMVSGGQVTFVPDPRFVGRAIIRYRVIAADGTATYSTCIAVRLAVPGVIDGGR